MDFNLLLHLTCLFVYMYDFWLPFVYESETLSYEGNWKLTCNVRFFSWYMG